MDIKYTEEDLIEFERQLVVYYIKGGLNVPLHLSGGNEKQLLKIFREIEPEDWIVTSHRNHYHALLKGVPQEEIIRNIQDGNGMTVINPEYRIYSSGIVGGQLPVGLGIAQAIKLRKDKNKVWAFCGDMAARMGVFHECSEYAMGQDLPIEFIIENNQRSVQSPTSLVWGMGKEKKVREYVFTPTYPHHGYKKRKEF
jgi:pyruvate dehydrogenase E1 component alpha subunit